jgi:hypothetical protein
MSSSGSWGQSDVRGWRAQLLLGWIRVPHIAVSAAAVATLLLSGTCLYRRVWHPDWTGAQALHAFWPLYLAAGLSIFLSWRFSGAPRSR